MRYTYKYRGKHLPERCGYFLARVKSMGAAVSARVKLRYNLAPVEWQWILYAFVMLFAAGNIMCIYYCFAEIIILTKTKVLFAIWMVCDEGCEHVNVILNTLLHVNTKKNDDQWNTNYLFTIELNPVNLLNRFLFILHAL